ncbi:biotin/lipoyl-binding protein [Rapidithrix thailandica]|uniref:Biotin/lipoyl-binding protein n=1 Tax=Rapidithrix thailandica TaxID=413964 RepID=A0AAW9SH74_9BACT
MKKVNLLFFVLLLGLWSCEKPAQEMMLKGKLKREVINVASKIPGRIERIHFQEGETVKKGDTLALIHAPEITAKIEQAEGAVAAAKAQYEMVFKGATKEQIEQVNAAYEAAKEQFVFAEKSYQRIKKMFEEKMVTAQKYDEVYAKYLMAQAQLDGTQAKQKEIESGVRSEKQKMALGSLKRAQGALKEAHIAYNERYLLAPADMRLTSVALKEGELALPGYNIFIGYAQQATYFRFTVPEAEVHQYKIDEVAKFHSPFDSSLQIQGRLVSILALPDYATRKSMNPNYEVDQALYELKFVPVSPGLADSIMTNITFVMPKK